MSDLFSIRMAKSEDVIDCIRLSKASWPGWRRNNDKLGRKHIKDCIQAKRCLVATKDDEIIAFLVWGTLRNKIHIQDIFVKEDYRKHGMATKLMQHAMTIAKKQGFKEIMSDCDVSNTSAKEFHLRCGFKECGLIKKNRDGEDSYVFSMKI
jgi:ribosomal protein S18 acetylase RimI-like enzyme